MKSGISSLGSTSGIAVSVAVCRLSEHRARSGTGHRGNTAEAKQEAREANAEVKQEAARANAEVEAGSCARPATRLSAPAIASRSETKDATHSVGATLDAAAQTMQIKTALIDADNLDANAIDVDTNGATKTVTLKGHVPTAAQKAAAAAYREGKGSGLPHREQHRGEIGSSWGS